MIQKLGTFLLGILICFLAMYFVNTRKIDSVIKDLKLENDSLHRANLVLDSLENKYIQELNNSTYEILKLETEDNALESKVNYMNKEIIIIKNKYEKARNYADSFGSDDIKRYFSELK
jgi:cupin superfamily acireductone dioxygenase involved in methionine salvage